MSLRSREKMRAVSPNQLNGHQTDTVEELANSTESLPYGIQQTSNKVPLFSLRPRQSSLVANQSRKGASTKEHPRSSSSLSIYTPQINAQRDHSQFIRTPISSVRSHSSPRSSSTMVMVSPSTPTEQEHQQWDSPSSSSSSSAQWQSSLSSPVTSIDTRSSFSSHSSPKTPISSSLTSFSNMKRKELPALRLEAGSLRSNTAPRLSLDPSILDSPTDPETQHVEFPLHQNNGNSLLLDLLKTKPTLMAYQPRSESYDFQVGLAI